VAGFPPRRPGFVPRSGHVEFLVDKEVLRKVFSEYFGLTFAFSFHQMLHTPLSPGAGTRVSPKPAKLGQGPVADLCEHGNKPSGSIKCWEFHEWLLKTDSAPRCWLHSSHLILLFIYFQILPEYTASYGRLISASRKCGLGPI
jgi:hypothetical protein